MGGPGAAQGWFGALRGGRRGACAPPARAPSLSAVMRALLLSGIAQTSPSPHPGPGSPPGPDSPGLRPRPQTLPGVRARLLRGASSANRAPCRDQAPSSPSESLLPNPARRSGAGAWSWVGSQSQGRLLVPQGRQVGRGEGATLWSLFAPPPPQHPSRQATFPSALLCKWGGQDPSGTRGPPVRWEQSHGLMEATCASALLSCSHPPPGCSAFLPGCLPYPPAPTAVQRLLRGQAWLQGRCPEAPPRCQPLGSALRGLPGSAGVRHAMPAFPNCRLAGPAPAAQGLPRPTPVFLCARLLLPAVCLWPRACGPGQGRVLGSGRRGRLRAEAALTGDDVQVRGLAVQRAALGALHGCH